MSTLLNDRDISLQAATYRSSDTLVVITSTGGAFKTPKNGAITTPASITLTATPNNVFTIAAIYTWSYALSASPNTWVALGIGTTKIILNSNILAIIGDSTAVQYRCIVTEALLNTASGFFTLTYSKDASEPIIVDITRTNAIIPCTAAGVPTGYPNTDASISVNRGGVALAYNAVGGVANTFKVSIQADDVARTIGISSNTSTVYTLSGITNIAVDLATVVFVVTVYDAAGIAVSPTIAKQITYTKVTNGVVGGDATFYYIDTSAPVVSKSTSSALITGTHTNITAIGKKVVGPALPTTAGFLTITANGDIEATVAVNSITTAINNTADKTSYTIKMYNQATVSGATLLDTEVIPVLFTGAETITPVLTNDTATIPTDSAGTTGIYTSTGTDIHVYEGTTELTYDAVGTTSGTWKIASNLASSITIGTITDSGLYASVGVASNIIADTASIVYTISGVSRGGNAFSLTKTQTFSKAYAGIQGIPGNNGTKSITISAFKWGTAVGTFAQAATYTWGTGISVYPTGWTSAAPASTANGQTLYQINLTITAIATDNTTAVNWGTAVSNTIGYRVDGTIGLQGNSARTAYIVTTSATPPSTPTSLTGDVAPTGWSFTATTTLSAGQFMYKSDGILTFGGNIAWGIPYLSNLKVGSLSAISADMGVVSISSTGSLASTGKTFSTGSGFYLGYDSTAYKFSVGNTTSYLNWDGSSIVATGLTIKNAAGTTILSSGTVPADIMNTNAVATSASDATTKADAAQVAAVAAAATTAQAKADAAQAAAVSVAAADASAKAAAVMASGPSLALDYQYWPMASGYVVTITDGVEGNTVTRIGSSTYINDGIYHPIDINRKYKTRFWARAAVGTNGILYQDLQQFTDSAGTTCANNGGRSPYYPSAQVAHTNWVLYEHVWQTGDWQAGVKYVRPDWLGNYAGTAGYWEVQGYKFWDVTETVDAAATAATAVTNAATAQGTANTAVTNASTAQGTANTAVTNASTAQGTANNAATAASNAATAASSAQTAASNAQTAVGAKLSKTGTDILSGVISLDTTVASGFKTGSLIWNSAGAWVSGSGVAMTPGGIVGYAGSAIPTFSVNATTGAAVFKGDVTGASGTFSGGLDVKSATTGARMEIKNNVIKVYDSSGILRVQLGDLAA